MDDNPSMLSHISIGGMAPTLAAGIGDMISSLISKFSYNIARLRHPYSKVTSWLVSALMLPMRNY